jgi:hypothetical protein
MRFDTMGGPEMAPQTLQRCSRAEDGALPSEAHRDNSDAERGVLPIEAPRDRLSAEAGTPPSQAHETRGPLAFVGRGWFLE